LNKDKYEIIVVDNASVDDTKNIVSEFISKYPGYTIKYVLEKKQGLSNSRNAGYKNASGSYVAYIDDDAKADPAWLENIYKVIRTVEPDIFGGPIYPFYESEKPRWFLDKYEIRTNGDKPRFLREDEYISGSNIVFKKELLETFGGFDTRLGMRGDRLHYGEEYKLIIDARKKIRDVKIYYDPGIVVYHLVRPEKMSMRFLVVSSFFRGMSAPLVWERKVDTLGKFKQIAHFMIIASSIFYQLTIGFLIRDRAKYRYIQNYIVEVVCPEISILADLWRRITGIPP
jgi:glycosyltransferase involved in cell wall biosynthesis